MYSSKGISIIICCHNSSKILPETIRHLCCLENKEGIALEILLVDNNSSDGTSDSAKQMFEVFNCRFPFTIIHEPVLGLSHARKTGFDNSKYEYLIYCDDDNRLNSSYADLSFKIMEKNKSVAALGGEGEAVTDGAFPEWFKKYSSHYSAGSQSEEAGDVTWTSGYVWGAGMVVRKSALKDLYDRGFSSMLSDRSGDNLSSGGDVEICYALRLAGWKIWYDPALKFRHYIPKEKLTWGYLRKLNRGFGAQKVFFDAYLKFQNINNGSLNEKKWKTESMRILKKIRSYGFSNLLNFFKNNEGNDDTLRIEKSIGRLTGILKMRKEYEKHFEIIKNAKWIRQSDTL